MTVQRHKYDYAVQPGSAPEKVISMVGANANVLELGPGPGSITRHLHKNGCRITALELDTQAINLVSEFCYQILPCDLNDISWPNLLQDSEKFSAIVAADVLEHLYDPWSTLRNMRPLLAAGGSVIISLPHVAHNAIVACLLNADFEYQPWGLLDKTHIRFWGIKNIQKLFDEAEFKIVDAQFVVRSPEQTEFAHFWHRLSASARSTLNENRFGNVYQVVIRAVPIAAEGLALRLDSLIVPQPVSSFTDGGDPIKSLLKNFGSRFSPAIQEKVVRQLRRLRLWH